MCATKQESVGSAVKAKQDADAFDIERTHGWVEASVWTDRMVSALVNGVKGGCWYSLMDKVYAPATLEAAWNKVRSNGGASQSSTLPEGGEAKAFPTPIIRPRLRGYTV